MACAGALEVSKPHPAGRTTAAAQTFLKTFLLFPYRGVPNYPPRWVGINICHLVGVWVRVNLYSCVLCTVYEYMLGSYSLQYVVRYTIQYRKAVPYVRTAQYGCTDTVLLLMYRTVE